MVAEEEPGQAQELGDKEAFEAETADGEEGVVGSARGGQGAGPGGRGGHGPGGRMQRPRGHLAASAQWSSRGGARGDGVEATEEPRGIAGPDLPVGDGVAQHRARAQHGSLAHGGALEEDRMPAHEGAAADRHRRRARPGLRGLRALARIEGMKVGVEDLAAAAEEGLVLDGHG